MNRNRLYLTYCVLGLMYLLVKIVWVAAGYLHPGAIAHGAVPAVLTVVVGLLGIKEAGTSTGWSRRHRLMLILPVLAFVITPLFMYFKQGSEWLTEGRLSVLVVYELLALGQVALAVVAGRRGTAGNRSGG